MSPSDKEIDELKAKHGKLEAICDDTTDEVIVVVRAPTNPEWDRFTAMILDDDQKANASKTLARACTVWPDAEIYKQRPALVGTVVSQLREMAGSVKSVSRKKL